MDWHVGLYIVACVKLGTKYEEHKTLRTRHQRHEDAQGILQSVTGFLAAEDE